MMIDSSSQKHSHTSPREFQTSLSQLKADTVLRFKFQKKENPLISSQKVKQEKKMNASCFFLVLNCISLKSFNVR